MVTASQASGDFDRALEAAKAKARCPKTHGKYKRTAIRALAEPRPETPKWSPVPALLGGLAVVFVVLALLLAQGCACPAADVGPKLEEAVDTYVGMSVPAPGVDPERHERAGASLKRAAEGVTRAHAE